MALSSTIYNFDIQVSDVDRNVYETLPLRVARHPSETEEYLVTRVLAYCLEYTEGIAFSKGLAQADEPALVVRDLTGELQAWIEVGAPDADRLHKASKASPRVAVYILKEPRIFLGQLAGARIHQAESIEIYAIDRALVEGLVTRLDRRTSLELAVTDRHIYATINGETLDGRVEPHVLAPADR
ncbi:MAG: hypothetical protein JWM41_3041 [Gemmatimonadetes bacterium]|nr:hypothetical protein [Gemmatimonadota bacterium]